MRRSFIWGRLLAALILVLFLLLPAASLAQRGFRGSFGRSGGSFGGRSFSGSFGTRSSSGSFGRTGSFGAPRSYTHTESVKGSPFSPRPSHSYLPPTTTYVVHEHYYGGYGYHPARYYGGFGDYSYYWARPSWTYWLPFHPAFYYNPPVYRDGYYEPGGFSFFHFLIGMAVFVGGGWLLLRWLTKPRPSF